jgi:putative ABC transport system permease protein
MQKAGIRRQAEIRATFDVMLQRVRELPDVEAAALTSMPPLGSARSAIVMPSMPGQAARVVNYVSPGYFETMGTRIVRGRGFTASDDGSGAPVMVVDEALAAERWPGEDPIGKCGRETSAGGCIEVVGVAERRRHRSLTESDVELFYPLAQEATSERIPQAVLVRMRPRASRGIAAVSRAIQGASERLPFATVRPLEDLANGQARSWRLGATVFGMFGALALGLASIGVYATLAFWVRQRTREIGVRMALGADRGAVLRMVLGSGLWHALVACLLGTAGAFALARYLRSLLFNVEPGDPLTFVAASVVLIVAALAGCVVPAVRASRVDASVALRYE